MTSEEWTHVASVALVKRLSTPLSLFLKLKSSGSC